MLTKFDIEKVTINLPFRLAHVHCFIAKGEQGYKIIDTGLGNAAAKEAWQPYVERRQIEEIIITHCHPDHVGYAGELQRLTNAPISITEIDAKQYEAIWVNNSEEAIKQHFIACGYPKNAIEQTKFINPINGAHPAFSNYLQEGDLIQFGALELEVIAAPGHSKGLIVLYSKEHHLLFSTDHILPGITPNISLRKIGEENPLDDYLTSLDKIAKLSIEHVIPSHGEPFRNIYERIAELKKHHENRLELFLSLLDKPATPFVIFEQVFKNRKFNQQEMRLALGEVLSHLEYLAQKGECSREFSDGSWYYAKRN